MQLNWLDTSLNCDDVDHSHFSLALRSQVLFEDPANKKQGTKLFGCRLKTRRHVHVWRQIGGVDLEIGSNRSFYPPTHVQSESHLH